MPSQKRSPSSPRERGRERRGSVDDEWLFDARELPQYVEYEGRPVRPCVLMFMRMPSRMVLPPHMVPVQGPEAVREAFELALAECAAPPPRVRVASPKLARWLGETIGQEIETEIVLAPTPELDPMWDSFTSFIEQNDRERERGATYSQDGRIPPEQVEEFFAAAKQYRAARPWKSLAGVPFAIEIAALEIDSLIVTPVEDDGVGGLAMFFDPDVIEHFYADEDADERDAPRDMLAVGWYQKKELPDSVRAELKAMPYASKSGPFPGLTGADPVGLPRPITQRDYDVAIVALRVMATYVKRYRDFIKHDFDDLPPGHEQVQLRGEDVVVRVVARPPRRGAGVH